MQDYGGRSELADLDWNLLRTFVVIVDEGGITRGAGRLMRTQPTISSALKRLEHQVGRRLVERGGGRFELTDHGVVLYRESRKVLDALGRLGSLMNDTDEEITGSIRIAMTSYVVFPPFDRILGEFHRRYPRVTFTLDIMPSIEVLRQLRDGLYAFGICLVSQLPRQLEMEVLFRESFGFFCGSSHPLFGRKQVSLEEMRQSAYVAFKTDQMSDALQPVAELRRYLSLGEEPIGMSSNLEEVRRMILCGVGIGALPIHAMERDVRDKRLWQLPPYEDLPCVDVDLVWHSHPRQSRAEQAFFDEVRRFNAATDLAKRTYP